MIKSNWKLKLELKGTVTDCTLKYPVLFYLSDVKSLLQLNKAPLITVLRTRSRVHSHQRYSSWFLYRVMWFTCNACSQGIMILYVYNSVHTYSQGIITLYVYNSMRIFPGNSLGRDGWKWTKTNELRTSWRPASTSTMYVSPLAFHHKSFNVSLYMYVFDPCLFVTCLKNLR